MAAMIARAQKVFLFAPSTSSFRDVPTNHWAFSSIEALSSRKWINGYGATFKPQGIATRAEVVVLISKAYKL
ncbi:S-layer homology domain-containing protein, partial [Bacillus sp. SIMBA_069]